MPFLGIFKERDEDLKQIVHIQTDNLESAAHKLNAELKDKSVEDKYIKEVDSDTLNYVKKKFGVDKEI